MDEVDRTMYSTFCGAANSLSQLYTQAMNQQKLTLQAGERHGLEKLYQWILRQQEGGSRVNTNDILNYLQTELDYSGEEPSMSPRLPHQNHHPQSTMHGFPFSSGPSGASIPGSGFQTEHSDPQPKNYVFSNALSSPIRRSLQNYHISQGDYHPTSVQSSVNGFTNNEPNSVQHLNGDSNSFNSNDSSMDMRPDSPNQ
ncbi:hypothetical protein RHSIM_Rhsim11G0087400 [Rhododendron simsii]|uniref:Holocarboxylase synthetase n=1 Tax=Rhododendron simsii TaxID=118357 RepID=A0A834L7K9_RHOSS|nr:hypothetical protein RHSIM_Rhsim11G0087400 [Rhododendron simsii]